MYYDAVILVVIVLNCYLLTARFTNNLSARIRIIDAASPQCSQEETRAWLSGGDDAQIPTCYLPRLDYNHKGFSPAFCYLEQEVKQCQN